MQSGKLSTCMWLEVVNESSEKAVTLAVVERRSQITQQEGKLLQEWQALGTECKKLPWW